MKAYLIQHFSIQFGVDLKEIFESYAVSPYQRYEQLFLIPERYLDHFVNLPYAFIGMPLGSWQGESFEPSHTFISRFGNQFTRGVIELDERNVEPWIAGRDIRHPQTDLIPQGQFLLVKDATGRNLGLGKLLQKRLRNMLPRHLI